MGGNVTITRRGFLGGMLAAGTLAACTNQPGTPGYVGSPSGTGPSVAGEAVLRVALIGAGGQGRALARRLVTDRRVALLTVCDPDSARAAKIATAVERAGGGRDPGGAGRPREVADLRHVLDDPRIDAVVIATPHHWHVLAAVWALEAGKHVYLEKPATHSLVEGSALLAAVSESGLVVEVGTQRRSHPGLAEAIGALHDGAIGPVHHARCYSWKRRRPIGRVVAGTWPATLDAELWFGPRPLVEPVRASFHYDWHWFYDYGNGGLGNNGVHRLDVARWGLGLPAAPIATLALAARLGPADSGQTPNTALTVVAFEGATVAHDLRGLRTAPTSRLDPGMARDDEVVFVGDGASLVVNRTSGRLVDEAGAVVRRYGASAADADPTARHLRRFVTACLDEDPSAVAVGLREGVAAAAMCHAPSAAHRSARSSASRGREVGEEAAEAIRAMCGPTMDRPTASFLAHVRERAAISGLTWSGMRSVRNDQVSGAAPIATEHPYREGYRLEV